MFYVRYNPQRDTSTSRPAQLRSRHYGRVREATSRVDGGPFHVRLTLRSSESLTSAGWRVAIQPLERSYNRPFVSWDRMHVASVSREKPLHAGTPRPDAPSWGPSGPGCVPTSS